VILTTALSIVGTITLLPRLDLTPSTTALSKPAEPAFSRIMKTSTVRCGYGIAEPWLYIDPNSKKVMGLGADVIEAIAEKLALKIDWAEETGWEHIGVALKNGRIDVGCSSLWILGNRAREMLFTDAYVYNPLYLYAHEIETRFHTMEDINQPQTRVSVLDGVVSVLLKERYFPHATSVALSALSTPADIFINLTAKKTDVAIADPITVATFNQTNGIKLKRLFETPLVAFGAGYPVAKGEYSLKFMLDNALNELKMSGELAEIIKKYTAKYPNSLLPPKNEY
jgi:ABC-type amino acid transport substrate-binding protein